MKLKYKFLRTGLKSDSGNLQWKIGQWNHEDKLDICHSGLHCSQYPDQAFSFVQGEILALVETKGKSIIQDDKECWSDMRIVKAYKWTKKDSVELAIYAAELVLPIWEKECPTDDRPRKAIEAAKNWLKKPCKETVKAANVASAANVANVASVASFDASVASFDASDASFAASYVASVASAASVASVASAASVASYAASVASAAAAKKIREWMIQRVQVLEAV